MTTFAAKIYFQNEAPRIGCGWRWVTCKVGRKWLRITDTSGRTARLPVAMLDVLHPERHMTKTKISKRKMKALMRTAKPK